MKIKQSANKHFEKDLPKAGGKTLTIVRSPTGVQAKSKRSLQGRLNPKLPINQIIVTYTPDVLPMLNLQTRKRVGTNQKRVKLLLIRTKPFVADFTRKNRNIWLTVLSKTKQPSGCPVEM